MIFIVVDRRVWHRLPTNRYDWLYSCSCSPRRSQLISGLSKSLQQEPSDLHNAICIHIKAICHLLVDYDSYHAISAEIQELANMRDHTFEMTTKLFGIQMNDNLIGVSMHNATSIGVLIKQHDTSIKCILCSSIQCEHVMLVKQWPLDDPDIPELLVDFMEQNVSTASLRDSFVNGPETIISKIEDDKGNIFLALIPPFPAINDDPCEACGSRFRGVYEDPREEGWHIKTVKMYGKRRIFDCYVCNRPCSGENCSNDMKYDGIAFTLLNMGSYLISYEVLREYMFLFLKGGVSMNTFYQSWALSLKFSLGVNLGETFKYNHWRSAWYAFLELLDIDFTACFECHHMRRYQLGI